MRVEYKITASFWHDTEGFINGFATLHPWLLRWIPDWDDPATKDNPHLTVDLIRDAEPPRLHRAAASPDLLAHRSIMRAARHGDAAVAEMHSKIEKASKLCTNGIARSRAVIS